MVWYMATSRELGVLESDSLSPLFGPYLKAKLKAEPETSSTVSQSLGVCRANFDSAVDSLRGAAKNLKEAASHADLMNNLSAATAFVETCNDAFAERRLNSPVAETTELLGKLVSNCLDLGSALQ
ncbi:uncharacterized protein LOC122040503 [Zingiber officinale]|uniref:uncharacterized protein LOC122040503 n=1 Tax=Zingiber officinale TaxID=94328 RepID=UPI001C4BA6AD|nr:uncharacterized protein LOC122040503 [Zingiber officinale]